MSALAEKDLEWWQTCILYQIYPRSFFDSNGNGTGDLKGVTSKLEYFQYLNVGAILLSPFYKSPLKDFGCSVSDFRDVDPLFGTLRDLEELVQEAHKKGLKVIVDFEPNHTSDQHDWFEKSCRSESPYQDYYIWHDGKQDAGGNPKPPNNWLSSSGGSAWRWHEGRQQFYYTAFLAEQPDLNYRNPAVVAEMNDVVRFWLKRGVDGMRVTALDFLFRDPDVSKDDPRSELPSHPEDNQHIHTAEQPEILDIVKGWRQIFNEFQENDGQPRFMVIESNAGPKWRNGYYEAGGNSSNLDLCQALQPPLSAVLVHRQVEQEYDNLPADGWPTFMLGNQDRKRVSSKFGAVYCDVLNMLLLTLRGTACTYYGEELGMQDISVTFEQTMDPLGRRFGPDRYQEVSRDPCRAPMQWDDTKNAGFSSNSSPWLPVHPDYKTLNVKSQRSSPEQTSLQLYAALALLRQDPVLQKGDLHIAVANDNVFSYVRQLQGSGACRYLVVLNLGQENSKDDYSRSPVNSVSGVVVQCTCSLAEKMKDKDVVLTNLELAPGDGMIIKLP